MFFNAMRRKGWNPNVEDMAAVVQIHNAVNERAWYHVMAWERLHESTCDDPRLVRFQGKPSEPTPKARVMAMLGYAPPFDRHDWVVDRCGTEVTYLIDFYRGASRDGTPSFHIDARPAIDSAGTLLDRARMPLYRALGIVKDRSA
jgi:cytochrome c heme-lyase